MGIEKVGIVGHRWDGDDEGFLLQCTSFVTTRVQQREPQWYLRIFPLPLPRQTQPCFRHPKISFFSLRAAGEGKGHSGNNNMDLRPAI